MVKKQQSIQTSLLVIIITLETFIFVGNIIPVLALHKEQQLLDNYDDLQEFADVVKGGDEEMVAMPLQSLKASNIYDDADESLQDCIYLAAKVGDNLADKEAVYCIEDVNFFNNKFSTDSSVPITMTSTTTTGTSATTGNNGTSTADADDEENNLINDLLKTGKFTEDEARELVTKVMNNGANVTATVPEAGVTATVPEANVTATVPEASVTATVPEASVTATTTGTSATTGNNDTSTFNGTSTADADDEENKLINDLLKTGKFTEDEAREFVTKVNLINDLVKTGKFTEDEARELVTKVMNNGANVTAPTVPEANVTAPTVPEAGVTAPTVPEAGVTATTTTGTSATTGNNGTSTADADDGENNLIDDLVKTGKFTEDEARELVTKVNLIDDLVKTGKFTE
ncbi:MAG TPA: hypothetical protein VIP70_04580, partial [Nitrososphaeraceae archaeon]